MPSVSLALEYNNSERPQYSIITYKRSPVQLFQNLIPENIKIRPLTKIDTDYMLASSMAGCAATMTGHPIDTIKVRMQMADSSSKYGLLRTVYTMIKQEGLMPFYRGALAPTAMRSMTTMIFFTANQYSKDNIIAHKRQKYIRNGEPVPDKIILSLWETFCVAAFCGFLLFPFTSTGDLIKIQLQNDKIHKNMADRFQTSEYKNMIDCSKTLFQRGQFHRGMLCTALRAIPGGGVYLLTYDAINRYYDSQAVLGNNETLGSFAVSLRVIMAGIIAGQMGWFSSYPLDYIKTQIQGHSVSQWDNKCKRKIITKPPRIRDIVQTTMKTYGIRGFFRGLAPCMIRAVPANMTSFWVYETVLQLRKNNNHC